MEGPEKRLQHRQRLDRDLTVCLALLGVTGQQRAQCMILILALRSRARGNYESRCDYTVDHLFFACQNPGALSRPARARRISPCRIFAPIAAHADDLYDYHPDTSVGEYSPMQMATVAGTMFPIGTSASRNIRRIKTASAARATRSIYKCRDARVCAYLGDDGPQNKYDKAACEVQEAAKAEQDKKYAEQLAVAKAEDHRKRMIECDKQPTMLGVLYCRFDNNYVKRQRVRENVEFAFANSYADFDRLGLSATTFLMLCMWLGPDRAVFLLTAVAIAAAWVAL